MGLLGCHCNLHSTRLQGTRCNETRPSTARADPIAPVHFLWNQLHGRFDRLATERVPAYCRNASQMSASVVERV
jgi:hypothetical protein